MTDKQFDILTHSIGMVTGNYRRSHAWWFDNDNHRNNFAASEGGDDFSTIIQLVELGWMKRGRNIPGGLIYFHVTNAGITNAKSEFTRRRKSGLKVPQY